MKIWAIADLHLAISTPEKSMEVFGNDWKKYHTRIADNWKAVVHDDDLVIIAGDTTWAKNLEIARQDLEWIDQLPGTKLISKGNHDYYWSSEKKMNELPFQTIYFLHNTPFIWNGYGFAGSRLWDSDEFSFDPFVVYRENPQEQKQPLSSEEKKAQNKKIFAREIERLDRNIAQLPDGLKKKIGVVHYPPIGADLSDSKASKIFEKYHIDIAIFGHLHSIQEETLPFGEKNGVSYCFTSADYLKFSPLLIVEE